jgi:hypothetical protein
MDDREGGEVSGGVGEVRGSVLVGEVQEDAAVYNRVLSIPTCVGGVSSRWIKASPTPSTAFIGLAIL